MDMQPMRSEAMRNSLTVRLMVVGILILVLLIPTSFVSLLVFDRQMNREHAVAEASSRWGNVQTVVGPLLTVPYRKIYLSNDKKERSEVVEYAHLLPEKLMIDGDVDTTFLQRGIYDVAVYTSQLNLRGEFSLEPFRDLGLPEADVQWDKAFVTVGIADLRGVKQAIKLEWNGQTLPFQPGLKVPDVVQSGVSTRVPLTAPRLNEARLAFALALELRGSDRLLVVPLGKATTVALRSDWRTPSFDGAFLPDQRRLGARGFTATWSVLDVNRNFPQAWVGKAHDVNDSAFGVRFLIPVDQYQKTMRAVKYAVLFIALTFLVFFLAEIFNRLRIHPFQYLLVGFALCLFYALLLSLSEYLRFDLAYALASLATTFLITAYSVSVFKHPRLSFVLGVMVLALYGSLYVLLRSPDYALLMGSVGLFVILAVVMYISRKVDWYAFGTRQ